MKEYLKEDLRQAVEGREYPRDYTAEERARIDPMILEAKRRIGLA